MKTSAVQKIFLSEKGQGLVEYALIITFVAAIAISVTLDGGLGGAIKNVFGSASDNLAAIDFNADDDKGEGVTSFDYETQTVEETTQEKTKNLKPLNWMTEIMPFADMTYQTIMKSDTVDKALSSEIGFFNTLFTAVEGHLASTNAADGTKDWESFLAMVDSTKTRNNISSTYVRDEQTITVKKVGKDLRITYADKEGTYYYKLSPDADNVMQIETNSNKSYSQFFASVMSNADGGWQYSNK